MDAKIIDLLEPVTVMGEQVTQLRLRSPRGKDLVFGGDVETWIRMPDGSIYSISNAAAIRRYAKALVVLPDKALFDGGDVFDALEIGDALKVSEAVSGFFTVADPETTSTGSKTSSSAAEF